MRCRPPRVIFCISLVSLAGCNSLTPQQRTMLTNAQRSYDEQRYQEAVDRSSRFLQDAPPAAPERARGHYVRGLSHARSGNRAAAYDDLQAAAGATDADISWRAHVALGSLHFEDGRWSAAASTFVAALAKMPKAPPMDTVLFRLGVCEERCGRWSESLSWFERVRAQFPESTFAEPARRRLNLRATHFAVQCGVFSRADNADALAAQLERSGLDAHVRREARGSAIVHVVLVGRYGGYPEAQAAVTRVRAQVSDAVLWP